MCESIGINFLFHLINNFKKVLSVLVLQHWFCQFAHLILGNPAITVGDALEACNLKTLAFFDNLNKSGGLRKGVVCAGIEPSEASPKDLNFQLTVLQELLVDGGNLQLSSRGWLDIFGHIHHLIGIEI